MGPGAVAQRLGRAGADGLGQEQPDVEAEDVDHAPEQPEAETKEDVDHDVEDDQEVDHGRSSIRL